MTSHNTTLGAIAIATCAIFAGACQSGADADAAAAASGTRSRTVGDLDLGDDWIESLAASGTGSGAGSETRTAPGAATPRAPTAYWGIVLGTYSDEGHAQAAGNMARSCATIDPRLAAAHVHTTPRGSLVAYGMYESAEDAKAQADLEWIKALERRGRRVFPKAMLARVQAGGEGADPDPYSLAAARLRHPDVDPLYTLQVAVWGTFESKSLTYEEICRRSAAYARELRAAGHEAYHHHDPTLRLSMVTVGLFDHTAVDPQSGFYAPEVELLLRKFPAHLVNGAPLNELVDPRRPNRGTRVQQPKLVLVP